MAEILCVFTQFIIMREKTQSPKIVFGFDWQNISHIRIFMPKSSLKPMQILQERAAMYNRLWVPQWQGDLVPV